jgi:predicted DNA-binding helix-hairpin-helix protein
VNRATRTELLRVPGIGPKSADAIVAARRQATFTELAHLHKGRCASAAAKRLSSPDHLTPSAGHACWVTSRAATR